MNRPALALVLLCAAVAHASNSASPLAGTAARFADHTKAVGFAQYSGYINVNATTNANIFYWLFESKSSPQVDPLILWLTGGPGCSSELAVFYENGPFKINADLSLSENPFSWNTFANVLYVDQPVGTGFSFVDDPNGYVTNEDEMAEQMYTMLQGFLTQYPKYQGLPFFIMGESYAGHYVPALAARVDIGNRGKPGVHIPLQALAIGNGMTDPLVQYKAYGSYAFSHGLIDDATRLQTEDLYTKCKAVLDKGDVDGAFTVCDSILDVINTAAGPFNTYDVRKTCPADQPLCYDFSLASAYLAQPQVLQSLGVAANASWSLCDSTVYQKIGNDWFNSERYVIPTLLDRYRVLVYNGVQGFICNFIGSEEWTRSMEWPGQAAFNNAPRKVWMVDEQIAGYALADPQNRLTMLAVNNAGHMVPMDQPANSLDMLVRFINNKPFA